MKNVKLRLEAAILKRHCFVTIETKEVCEKVRIVHSGAYFFKKKWR